mmetsp:Transcript_23893/g.27530  ORF Transcript_23893/g.27530 Transcript_23893/m.27530 type:complete len:181 (+) Transcript_23893:53-595(+)
MRSTLMTAIIVAATLLGTIYPSVVCAYTSLVSTTVTSRFGTYHSPSINSSNNIGLSSTPLLLRGSFAIPLPVRTRIAEGHTSLKSSNNDEDSDSKSQLNVPLNIPSPLLLGSSMILAIAGVGSMFDIAGGSPQLGFPLTESIATVGTTISLYFFYCAILKGISETEEDDEKFNKDRRNEF